MSKLYLTNTNELVLKIDDNFGYWKNNKVLLSSLELRDFKKEFQIQYTILTQFFKIEGKKAEIFGNWGFFEAELYQLNDPDEKYLRLYSSHSPTTHDMVRKHVQKCLENYKNFNIDIDDNIIKTSSKNQLLLLYYNDLITIKDIISLVHSNSDLYNFYYANIRKGDRFEFIHGLRNLVDETYNVLELSHWYMKKELLVQTEQSVAMYKDILDAIQPKIETLNHKMRMFLEYMSNSEVHINKLDNLYELSYPFAQKIVDCTESVESLLNLYDVENTIAVDTNALIIKRFKKLLEYEDKVLDYDSYKFNNLILNSIPITRKIFAFNLVCTDEKSIEEVIDILVSSKIRFNNTNVNLLSSLLLASDEMLSALSSYMDACEEIGNQPNFNTHTKSEIRSLMNSRGLE